MINLEKIKKAHEAISPYINRTPLILSNYLSKDRIVKLKLESLQITNSFKLRGATNKLLSLDECSAVSISSLAVFQRKNQGVVISFPRNEEIVNG